jgi:hypothetical protein
MTGLNNLVQEEKTEAPASVPAAPIALMRRIVG